MRPWNGVSLSRGTFNQQTTVQIRDGVFEAQQKSVRQGERDTKDKARQRASVRRKTDFNTLTRGTHKNGSHIRGEFVMTQADHNKRSKLQDGEV